MKTLKTFFAITIVLTFFSFSNANPLKRAHQKAKKELVTHKTKVRYSFNSILAFQDTNNLKLDDSYDSLPVKLLYTSDPGNSGFHKEDYPKKFQVQGIGKSKSQVAAYGGAYQIWLGLQGWKGTAESAEDGSLLVYVFPKGGSDSLGPRISYSQIPRCFGCILSAAAPYFPDAMKRWNENYNQYHDNSIKIPKGLITKSINPKLKIYMLPDKNGLARCGIVFYDSSALNSNKYLPFAEADFILPPKDSTLVNLFIKSFYNEGI